MARMAFLPESGASAGDEAADTRQSEVKSSQAAADFAHGGVESRREAEP